MARVQWNHVIEQLNFKYLTCSNEVAGHLNVSFARGGVSARMIVHYHNSGRSGDNGTPKHLSRMHDDGVERADGEQLMSLDPASCIEQQCRKTLAIRIEIRICGDSGMPVIRCVLRRFA